MCNILRTKHAESEIHMTSTWNDHNKTISNDIMSHDQGETWNMLEKSGSELVLLLTTIVSKGILSNLVSCNIHSWSWSLYIPQIPQRSTEDNSLILFFFLLASTSQSEMTTQLQELKHFYAVRLVCTLALKALQSRKKVWSILHKGHTTTLVLVAPHTFTAEQGPAYGPVGTQAYSWKCKF